MSGSYSARNVLPAGSSVRRARATYAQYEIGRRTPDYDTLRKLADFFEVSTDSLLGRTDDPTPPHVKKKPVIDPDLDTTFPTSHPKRGNTQEGSGFQELPGGS
ncbi:MAG: helix-turn-helix domain-containing protein [Alicyclobacillaceae bacterium]|nr:helix-turn-helix domain-containing protein [Alicyclobacillaceae bacterium]